MPVKRVFGRTPKKRNLVFSSAKKGNVVSRTRPSKKEFGRTEKRTIASNLVSAQKMKKEFERQTVQISKIKSKLQNMISEKMKKNSSLSASEISDINRQIKEINSLMTKYSNSLMDYESLLGKEYASDLRHDLKDVVQSIYFNYSVFQEKFNDSRLLSIDNIRNK